VAEEPTEKRVSWAELFFDLVFVFAVTQVSALLHEDHSWAGVGRALILFAPMYWAWVGVTVFTNTRGTDSPRERIGILAIGLGSLFMAMAVPAAFDDRGLLFGCSYLGLRIVTGLLVLWRRPLFLNPVSLSLILTGPLLVVGGILHGPARVAVWAVAAFVDLSSPALTRRQIMAHLRFDAGHLTERFGLLIIIALGESIVATGASAAGPRDLPAPVLLAVAAAFALVFGLWWVYFHFASDAVRHALTTAVNQADVVRRVLTYGHLSFLAGIITMAVGVAEVVAHPGPRLSWPVAALLYGGCALYLATFGYTRWMMFRQWATRRLIAAGCVLVLLPLGVWLPGLAALVFLAAIVAVLNVWEFRVVARVSRL
jgi:low temperature requirement protein LtrA